MSAAELKKSFLKRILAIILSFGPGIFAIGYTIGTGSVTAMIVAGSTFGMQLLWVLNCRLPIRNIRYQFAAVSNYYSNCLFGRINWTSIWCKPYRNSNSIASI